VAELESLNLSNNALLTGALSEGFADLSDLFFVNLHGTGGLDVISIPYEFCDALFFIE
jgi:hypothetical protein